MQGIEMRTVTERKPLNNIGKNISELFRDSFQCPGNNRSWSSLPLVLPPGSATWLHLTRFSLDRITGSVVIITDHPTDLLNPSKLVQRGQLLFLGCLPAEVYVEMKCCRKDRKK